MLLLKIWKDFSERHPGTLPVLIGGGDLQHLSIEKSLKAFVSKRDLKENVYFTGYHRSTSEYLRASDCFVSPSGAEGMPNSLLEALASGLPCVVSRIGGVVDIVKEQRFSVEEMVSKYLSAITSVY